jgi:DNA-3-methyladenine glycosylase II
VENSWRRALTIENHTVEVAVSQGAGDQSSVQVQVTGPRLTDRQRKLLYVALEKCLGLSKNLSAFYMFATKDNVLNALARRFLGLKPPRFPTVFEGVVNGIACQQLSLDLGITLLNRLCANYGREATCQGYSSYAFPCPEDLTSLTPDDFRKLGYPRQKGRAIIELSQSIASGKLDLEELENVDNQKALARLCELRGVGRWTGEYVLLRGLGRIDVFPADDIGGRRGLQQLLNISDILDYEKTREIVSHWEPYAGFVYFHLLMNRLVREGWLT